jgi:electron transfer flavoprotein beta subunit
VGLPYLSNAATIEPTDGGVRVQRITATGFETLEASTPALIGATQALGAPRYPTLKGIMGARSKEVAQKTLADLGLGPSSAGTAAAGTRVTDLRQPPPRGETRIVRGPAADAAKEVVDFLAARGLV